MDRNHESLIARLDQLIAADELEVGHRAHILELLQQTEAPFSRDQFLPGHITASAFVVDPQSVRVLLHHHRRLGRWLQMGGHVDPGESVAEAALREAFEESGLPDLELMQEPPIDLDVHAIPAGKGEPDHHHFDVRFLVATSSPDHIAIDAAESLDLRWFSLTDAAEAMREPGALRALQKVARILETRITVMR